jgi:hypothetical protein
MIPAIPHIELSSPGGSRIISDRAYFFGKNFVCLAIKFETESKVQDIKKMNQHGNIIKRISIKNIEIQWKYSGVGKS